MRIFCIKYVRVHGVDWVSVCFPKVAWHVPPDERLPGQRVEILASYFLFIFLRKFFETKLG